MVSIDRLQAYLQDSARQQYEAVSVPGFTLFFHPTDALAYWNYGIPDEGCCDDVAASLSALRREFARRNRRPRIEYIEAYAPQLAPALQAHGFRREERQPLMACGVQAYLPPPPVPELRIGELTRGSTVEEARVYLETQRRGFGDRWAGEATQEEAEAFLGMVEGGTAFIGWLGKRAVGVGMHAPPIDGVVELVGLAIVADYRGRGIGTTLAAHVVRRAFEAGVEVVCLTAADERTGRMYERIGFSRCGSMLAYVARESLR